MIFRFDILFIYFCFPQYKSEVKNNFITKYVYIHKCDFDLVQKKVWT